MSENGMYAIAAVAWATAFAVIGSGISSCIAKMPSHNELHLRCIEARGTWDIGMAGSRCLFPEKKS